MRRSPRADAANVWRLVPRARWLLALALAAATLVAGPAPRVAAGSSAIVPGSVNRTSLSLEVAYDARVYIGYAAGTMAVISYMDVRNESGAGIDRLELNTVAARLGSLRDLAVTVDGRAVSERVSDQTIVAPLGGVLPDGETMRVRVAFRATFRSSLSGHDWLFARANGTINAYRWLPWVSRARPFDRPNHGDPFVTATSPRVEVTIRSDRALGIATSGHRVSADGTTQRFVATNVRDFVLTASPYYRTTSGSVGDTRVIVYYRSGAPASTMLDLARRALSRFNSLVGPYPHSSYTIAQSAGGYAMESPGHTWIPPVDSSRLPYLISHETAHQWFYGIVGNDQAHHPFADEAMTDFLTRYSLGSFRDSGCSSNRLDLSIYDYSSNCYYELIYVKGANVLNDVRGRMGNASFWSAVRAYADRYDGRIVSTKTLLDFLDARTSEDLVPLYRTYFPSLY